MVRNASLVRTQIFPAAKRHGQRDGTKYDARTTGETHVNLAAKQKAVAAPTLKHRSFMQTQKKSTFVERADQDDQTCIEDAQETKVSIAKIESSLPPLRGNRGSFSDYVDRRHDYQPALDAFYNDPKFKQFKCLAQEARSQEYYRLADALLRMVGGTIGEKRKPENKVVIGIGLGKFSSSSRLSSLHGTFEDFFIGMARSLDYLVVGVNEYYTSKRCPTCENFVGQTKNIRRLYCGHCHKFIHRDIMAGQNMCNVLRGHVERQERPLYRHPVDQQGNSPWKGRSSSSDPTESLKRPSEEPVVVAQGKRKRA
ncbi:hypothetical protein BG004_007042 [Podila humilis]|nr:hypothetical protein BG004_007042 [Podila humilis]